MSRPTAVINIVGLSESLVGEHTPAIAAFAREGQMRRMGAVLPAVTCSAQASMLTGVMPSEHGIVGNGWYNRSMAEVQFWKQSNHLVTAEKVWETARQRDPSITCAKLFWWYNMYASVDFAVTPRPIYKADGRKIPNVHTQPADLGATLQAELGTFPLFRFWGPAADITSTRWIADSAKIVHERFSPTLTLVYLPHLDYSLQKLGPDHPAIAAELRAVDSVVDDLIRHFRDRGVRVILLSEYGIEPVTAAIPINRALREDGALAVHVELGHELLDAGASRAFAVADHQIAHVYLRDAAETARFADLCRGVNGVQQVLQGATRREAGLDHPRAGDLVLVAEPGRWFSYHYWLDEARAPDFARTVEIHRKPGYDPLELFLDPTIPMIKPRLAVKLLRKKLGFRTLMNVIPLDTSLVRGSHGRVDVPDALRPVLITEEPTGDERDVMAMTGVRDVVLRAVLA